MGVLLPNPGACEYCNEGLHGRPGHSADCISQLALTTFEAIALLQLHNFGFMNGRLIGTKRRGDALRNLQALGLIDAQCRSTRQGKYWCETHHTQFTWS